MEIWEIEWDDSTGKQGWIDKSDVDGLLSVHCVITGYLVKVTESAIILAAGYNPDYYMNPMVIHRGSIRKARKL